MHSIAQIPPVSKNLLQFHELFCEAGPENALIMAPF